MKSKLNLIIALAIMGLVASKSKRIKIEWTHITLLSVVAFVAGWWLFGLLGAVLLAIVVMVLMGIIRVSD